VPEVRKLYRDVRHICYGLNYSASSARQGREILFFSDSMEIPVSRLPDLTPRARAAIATLVR